MWIFLVFGSGDHNVNLKTPREPKTQNPLQWKLESWNIINLMPLKQSKGNPSMNHPKSMFQLSGVHYKHGTQALSSMASIIQDDVAA